MVPTRETETLPQVTTTLAQEFPTVEAPEIDAHVREVLRSYDDAKVRSFLPVLVQRQVREILRQRALVMTLTARDRDEALSQT